MYIEIEPQSEVPIYMQLAQQIMEGVANGQLLPGSPLPSGRAFAADLGMNMHTVNKAYHYLEEKKIIEIIPKKGVFIHADGLREATAEEKERIEQELRPILAEALCLKLSKEEMAQMIEKLMRNIQGGVK
ncbi:GntR family transcriptional regulator [Planococcus shenhongbingii]|uniref:GntR family transcriptional regulator n=1 Tax=Planococcus shenhongbingii TaxID=3058398 RepID=A0ABT8NB07_9BACL|nr:MULTISPECIES: GntR family transcriptional regulator [unclassified Planococcus (in: firmicutes)]MDN7245031.1 GntR family transcriptional regulator [Planococcus sp. N017]WKA58129.1 GntR family transcriptional regulator [Planococcus sp. N016]